MAMTLLDRKKVILSIPWVKEIDPNLDCQAKTRRKQPCKRFARWQFISIDKEVFYFCFEHLIYSGFDGSIDESRRFDRWWKRNQARFLPADNPNAIVEPPE